MKSDSPPPPPNPQDTIQAAQQANLKTAKQTQKLAMVNQATPYGALTYKRDSSAPGGYRVVQTLSPQEQAKQEQQWAFDKLSNQTGLNQANATADMFSKPIDLSNEATEARLFELGRARLDPKFEQGRAALDAKLYNQGVMPGTEAYNRAVTQFGQQENDAYTQLLLAGRGQSVNEAVLQRSIPMAEIAALMGRGEVQQPNWINTPQPQVQGVDTAGITMDAYKYGPLAQYQAQQAQNNAMMSGLFGMGSAALGGWAMSDRRLKTDIERVGEFKGLPVYTFRFKGDSEVLTGFMADEVETVMPEAVREVGGYKQVNYPMILGG